MDLTPSDWTRQVTLVVTYDPATDEVLVDSPLGSLLTAAILEKAHEVVEYPAVEDEGAED